MFDRTPMCLIFLIDINVVNEAMDDDETLARRNGEITLKQLHNLYNNGRGGLHQQLTTLHSTRLPNLHKLHYECKQLRTANRDQRFKRIVLDVCSKKLFSTGTHRL